MTDPADDAPPDADTPDAPHTPDEASDRSLPTTDPTRRASDPEDIADEDALVLTTIAVPYGDRIATYDAAGTGIIWRVPPALIAKAAGGELPRREAGEGVTAQCVVVDQKRSVLKGLEDDEWPATMLDDKAAPVSAAEYRERLRLMLVAATRRGESVIFAGPGRVEMTPPCVRASVVQDDEGGWVSIVEAFPALDVPGWEDAERDDDGSTSWKTAPADESTLTGAVMLMLIAAQSFAPGPEQIGLFFEAAPDGPWV